MKKEQRDVKKRGRILLIAVVLLVTVCGGGFFLYVSDYYRAEEPALDILKQEENISVRGNLTILSSEFSEDTGIIFYPGAKVETEAYLPLLNQIRDYDITCVLIDMPFHMAIFDPDAAAEAMEQLPKIQNWYVAGHSMGGAMASKFASEHPDQVEGLILLGAYIYGDYPLEKTLTVYGTQDGLAAEDIDYTTNTVKIQGGNHAQFGNYGVQKGDLPATVSAQEQQQQTVRAILKFLDR